MPGVLQILPGSRADAGRTKAVTNKDKCLLKAIFNAEKIQSIKQLYKSPKVEIKLNNF